MNSYEAYMKSFELYEQGMDRNEELEKHISRHPIDSYLYSINVIKERFKMSEIVMVRNGKFGDLYFYNIMKFNHD